jgi:hypothetical protein
VHDVVELPEPFAKLRANTRIEGAERLVEEEYLRLGCESSREGHPLPLSARELSGIAVTEVLQLDEGQELVYAVADLRSWPLAHHEAERDIVTHGHVLERGVVLEHEPDVPFLGRERGCVLSGQEDLAGVG